jgi:hypothetical protein
VTVDLGVAQGQEMTASMAFFSALGVADPVGACFFSSRMRAPILPSRSPNPSAAGGDAPASAVRLRPDLSRPAPAGGWCASGHVPALSRAKPAPSGF